MHAPDPAGIARRFGNPPGSGAHTFTSMPTPSSATSRISTTTSRTTTTDGSATATGTGLPGPDSGAVQYYYVFIIVVFGVFVGILWMVHLLRRRRLATSANGRQNALAQDVSGYPNNRGWARRAFGGDGILVSRRDEGLDERGEAPPPYKPASQRQSMEEGRDPATDNLAIPLQTYSIDGRNFQKPPDYEYQHAEGSGESTQGNAPESSSAGTSSQQPTTSPGRLDGSTGENSSERRAAEPSSATSTALASDSAPTSTGRNGSEGTNS